MRNEVTDGGADARILEPLIELFRFDEVAKNNARSFTVYCQAVFVDLGGTSSSVVSSRKNAELALSTKY